MSAPMAGGLLTDEEALSLASDALGVEGAKSVPANTALEAARQTLSVLIVSLETAIEPDGP
jgi:hypothetical protein